MIERQAILDAFNFRHACKQFDAARKIPADEFEFILEAGRLSPSSFGYEPWQCLVIQDPALRQQLLPMTWGAQKTLPSASHYLAILARRAGMEADGAHIRHMQDDIQKLPAERIAMRNKYYDTFMRSDFKVLDHPNGLFEWSCRQAYIALGNMMTVAAMRGIDSCPIEGFVRADAEQVLRAAGLIDDDFGLAVMVAFGYRQDPQPAKTRRPASEVVRWVG